MENVLKLVYFVMVVATMFGAFALVTFSTVGQVQQPTRSLFLGLGSSAVSGSRIDASTFVRQSIRLAVVGQYWDPHNGNLARV
jgi:hypothetical protein